MDKLKIAIAGANGRMGRVLVEAVNNHPGAVLSGALGEGLTDSRQLGGVELDGERVETGGFDVECWLHRCDGVVI